MRLNQQIVASLMLLLIGGSFAASTCQSDENLITIHITEGTDLDELVWNVTSSQINHDDEYNRVVVHSYCLPQALYYVHFQGGESTQFAYQVTVDGDEIASGHVYTSQALMHFDTAEVIFEMTSTRSVEWTLSKFFEEIASGESSEVRRVLDDGSYALEMKGGSALTVTMNGKTLYSSLGTSLDGETVYFRIASGIAFLLSASQFEEAEYNSVGYHMSTATRVLLALLCIALATIVCVMLYRKRRNNKRFAVELGSTADSI